MLERPRCRGAAAPRQGLVLEDSGQHFGELDQVTERIAEEGELAADRGQDEGLGDDRDVAAAKLATVSSTFATVRQK
jgi:hypothetical protein